MPKFSSLIDFQKRFPDDEACLSHLQELRWANGFVCPNCGPDVGYKINFRRLIQCAVFRHQASPTAGTIFHKTRTRFCLVLDTLSCADVMLPFGHMQP